MELVYLYIEKAHGEKYDLHLDFSQDLQIRWDKQKSEFSMNKVTSPTEMNFFSENIINVTGIAGKNGSGKTTVINTLFLLESINYRENLWLIIFKKGGQFYIEGTIDEVVVGRSITRRPYSFYGELTSKFKVDGFLQYTDENVRNELCFLSLNDAADDHERPKEMHLKFQRFLADNREGQYQYKLDFLLDHKRAGSFKISRTLTPSVVIGEPTFINNKLDLANKEIMFLERLKEFWTPSFLSRINREKMGEPNKNEFLLKFSRYIFDSLVNCLLFFKQQGDRSSKLLNMIEEIIAIFQDTTLLDKPSVLKKYIVIILKGFNEDFKKYIPGHMDITYLSTPVFNFDKVFNFFKKLPEECFKNRSVNELCVEFLKGGNSKEASDLLAMIDIWNYKYGISGDKIICNFGKFSAGEMQLIELFSRLNSKLIQVESEAYTTAIVVLDEYDQNLHPEWARKFLNYLISYLSTFKSLKIQLILTTHSPYLVSDLPKENIILIEKNDKTETRNTRKSQYGFASNYYDIMHDSFFLDDTIGEFAKQKINGCIEVINRTSNWINTVNNKEEEEFYSVVKDKLSTLKTYDNLLAMIGDPFIHEQLTRLLNATKERLSNELKDVGQDLYRPELVKEREALKERIRAINEELKND